MPGYTALADELPVLGVGLSLSLGVEPDPVRLAGQPGGPSFVEYAGPVQVAAVASQVAALHRLGRRVLYHPSCLNLCGPWPNPPGWIEAVAHHCRAIDSAWLAQDVAICFTVDEGGYSIDLGYFVPPVLDAAGLDQAAARVREVQAALDRPLLLEPAPVSFQVGPMSIFAWLGALAERTDCGILLDAGHVLSHGLLRRSGRPLDGLEALDLGRVVELHLAGGLIEATPDGPIYVDAHDLPILPEVWALGEALVRRCPRLRAVCVECEGAVGHTVLPVLQRTRELLVQCAASEGLRHAARVELAGPGRGGA